EEAQRIAKEEADKKAKEEAEKELMTAQQREADRLAREESERKKVEELTKSQDASEKKEIDKGPIAGVMAALAAAGTAAATMVVKKGKGEDLEKEDIEKLEHPKETAPAAPESNMTTESTKPMESVLIQDQGNLAT